MRRRCFRRQLDAYESALADWGRFTVGTCRLPLAPTRIEVEDNGKTWLIHEKLDGDPIQCVNGEIIRALKLGFGNAAGWTVH